MELCTSTFNVLSPLYCITLSNSRTRLLGYADADEILQLHQQTQTATQIQYDRAGNAMAMADAEIARFHEILRQIDELQVEFDKVRRIGEIVKAFRSRVEALDRRV